jgi:hypothetical protein
VVSDAAIEHLLAEIMRVARTAAVDDQRLRRRWLGCAVNA